MVRWRNITCKCGSIRGKIKCSREPISILDAKELKLRLPCTCAEFVVVIAPERKIELSIPISFTRGKNVDTRS